MHPPTLPAAVRWLAGMEVVLAVAAFQLCTWVLAPRVASTPMAWVFIGTLLSSAAYPVLISARLWKRLGAHSWVRMPWPTVPELASDARYYTPLTFVAAMLILLLSLTTNPGWQGVDADRLVRGLLRYVGLAAVQVFFFFVFILPRLAAALQSTHPEDHRISAIFAAIFALCHLPNPQIMILGALIVVGWASLYRHRPNPIMVYASHVLLGTLLAEVAQLHMRIGVAYSTPGYRPFRVALQSILGDVVPLN